VHKIKTKGAPISQSPTSHVA